MTEEYFKAHFRAMLKYISIVKSARKRNLKQNFYFIVVYFESFIVFICEV